MPVERGQQPPRARSKGQAARDRFHRLDPKTRDPGEARTKRGRELDLAAHRRIGDRGHFTFGARRPGKLVDDLGIYQGRVHVETDELTPAAPAVVTLHRDVDAGPRECGPKHPPDTDHIGDRTECGDL